MSKSYFFLLNPTAGGGKIKNLWPSIHQTLQSEGLQVNVAWTRKKGDGIALTREAAQKNYKAFIAVGGDGTFHEMINGLMNSRLENPVAFLLPVGSGNDFARMHAIPKWSRRWMETLLAYHTIPHNVGHISFFRSGNAQSRFFANVAGAFYDGYIVRAVSKRKRPLRSSIHYLALVIKYLFRYSPPFAKIIWDEGSVGGQFYTLNAGICQYSGGGMRLVPHANPSGEKLAVTIARKMHPLAVLAATPYFYNGKVARHPKVICFDTTEVSILPKEEKVYIEADGEYLGYAPCTIRLVRNAFHLIVPR